MKRDMELVRRLVLDLEAAPVGEELTWKTDDWDGEVVGHHMYLLLQAGLPWVKSSRRPGTPFRPLISGT